MREHLLIVARATGSPPAELNEPECPGGVDHLLRWFHELGAARTVTGFGVNPITYSDIDAYFRLNALTPTSFELHVLRRLDEIFLQVMTEKRT